MKYPQLVSSSTPASLQDWLEEELESRGIDGVYTRYILSLLQQDTIDLDLLECEHISPPNKHIYQINKKETDKSKHYRAKSWERELKRDLCNCSKPVLLDVEKRKKSAAVECLKSASEQKVGIEKLIDEVCTKLKHVQNANAMESIQLLNSSPKLCLQHSDILESSLQEQAEKYYAAFPALSGKHEPLAKLYQRQEMWTVWDGRKLVASVNEEVTSEALVGDLVISDIESDSSEKENRSNSSLSTTKLQDSKKAFQVNAKSSPPSFIVPKMKIPIHKVSNLSMYSPFTSSAYQVGKTIGNHCKMEYYTERKVFGGLKQDAAEDDIQQQPTVAAMSKKFVTEADTWELLSSLGTPTLFEKFANDNEYQENVTDLANKFDSNLASIWAKADVDNIEDAGVPEELEVSLRILSLKTPTSGYDFGLNKENSIASVWATSLDDFKNMKLHERLRLASIISLPNLLQSLASQVESQELTTLGASSPHLNLEDIGTKGMEGALSSDLVKELKHEEFDDVESILFACPNTLFSTSSRNTPISSEYGSISPAEDLAGSAQRIYHLWEENEKKQGSDIWGDSNSNSLDKVVNWMSNQHDTEVRSVSSLKVEDGWKMPFPANCSPSRENCTITYHKGESRFVEVIPSNKNVNFSKTTNIESNLASNTLSVEDGENLLTSPKTHFQPIHQDSSDGESVIDETEIAITPMPEDSLPSSTPELLSPPPEFKRSRSSSLDELVGLAELSSLFKEADGCRDGELLEMITRGWKSELLEDKCTSTESPCIPPPVAASNMLSFRENKIWSSGSVEDAVSEVGLPWKWSTTDDSADPWLLANVGKEDEFDDDIFEESRVGSLSEGVSRDYNLKALRKELEEEEEELFRDINCLSDSDADVHHKENTHYGSTTYVQSEDALFAEKLSSCFKARKWEANGQALKGGDSLIETKNKEYGESDDADSSFPLVPVDKVLYSSELEDEWIKTSEPFDVQVPKKLKSKTKMLSQKRPCTFYLEGNCRRSDCKFSHDLASITCRFWEEGSCFKGITCPFLHGYISDIHLCEEDAPSRKFALESESDFPSLANSGIIAGTSVKAPYKSTGRIIRPKKKRQSTNDNHKRLENPEPTSV